jgi:hypothetical protein
MPWSIHKRGSQWCVVKEGDSSPVPGGCHESRSKAVRHQRALYAGESSSASAEGGSLSDMSNSLWYFIGPNSTSEWISTSNGAVTTEFSTITVNVDGGEATEEGERTLWEGILALEGSPTGDRRYLMPGEIDERDLPLPFMVQIENDEGHKGSELGGRIDSVIRIPVADFEDDRYDLSDLPETAVVIWGEGFFDSSDAGREGQRMVDNGGGVSVDMSVTEVTLLDPETYEEINIDDLDIMEVLFGGGDFITGIKGRIMGATVLAFPAFEEAQIQVVTASGTENIARIYEPFGIHLLKNVLTASAAGLAPLAPPREWFEMPEPDLPTPLTVTEDGRVYGHLAVWGQCHTGFKDYCQTAPPSYSEYKFFHLGTLETAEGDHIGVGKITLGTGHAPISYSSGKTLEHYDNTGCVAAFVRAVDGQRGIWISGAIRSDLPAERVRDLGANPPSGDWRMENGALELQAILSVPVPGFPVPHSEARLVASGEVEEMEALVATGFYVDWPKRRRRKKKMLSNRLHTALERDQSLDSEPPVES